MLLGQLEHEASKKGLRGGGMSKYIRRKTGEIIITRVRIDGSPGCSLPCVLCRRSLEKHHLRWCGFTGTVWVRSIDAEVPRSLPTSKQVSTLGFRT